MTEKKKPGRKPRKVEESAAKTLSEKISESEARRESREDLLHARNLEAEARRHAREDAVEERRLAHDLRRMEATEAMFSRFAQSVVGVARDGVQAMMPVYNHVGSEATRDIILAQVESQKHAMALLTTVLVEGVPAAIRAYAEVRAASTPSPVTHEEFKVWTDTLMGHVYARNEAHLDLLDATIRTSATSSFASTLASLPRVSAEACPDCDDAEEYEDEDRDSDSSSRGFGGLEDYEFTRPATVASDDGEDILSKMFKRPPSASRTGKDVIVSVRGYDVGFDYDFSEQVADARLRALDNETRGEKAIATIALYGEMGEDFGSKPLVTFALDELDDPLHAISETIRMLLPQGGDAKFRVVVSHDDEVFLDTVFTTVCVKS